MAIKKADVLKRLTQEQERIVADAEAYLDGRLLGAIPSGVLPIFVYLYDVRAAINNPFDDKKVHTELMRRYADAGWNVAILANPIADEGGWFEFS